MLKILMTKFNELQSVLDQPFKKSLIFWCHENEVFNGARKFVNFSALKEIENFLNREIINFAGPEKSEIFRRF